MDIRSIKNALRKLNRRRAMVAQRLDSAYIRDDVSLYITLEDRHRRLGKTIDRLVYRLKSRGVKITGLGSI